MGQLSKRLYAKHSRTKRGGITMALFVGETGEKNFTEAMERVANRIMDYLEKKLEVRASEDVKKENM